MISVGQLIERITVECLLPAEAEISSLLSDVRSAEPGQRLTDLLLRQGLVTEYQARVLLSERDDRLVLGDYILLNRLCRGGTCEVFIARRRTGQLVALKVLTGTPPTELRLRQFEREVEAIFRVRHPNIIAACDAGEADGRPYLATEYVDGSDLAQHVTVNGPLSVSRAVDCVAQAARGLGHAHDLGVVHRDVKPSNLLIGDAANGNFVVKIADFGLARIMPLGSSSTESDGLVPGTTMGTADYMPPEQIANASQADRRSDVYGLGATLWFLLTGRPMYTGQTLVEVLRAHQDEPVPSLHSVRSDVSDELDRVFQRAVTKRPQDRLSTMSELIFALEATVRGETEAPSIIFPAGLRGKSSLFDECIPMGETAVLPTPLLNDDISSRQ